MKALNNECQTLRCENYALKDELKACHLDQKSLEGNDEKVRMLTGLPSFPKLMAIFSAIVTFLKPKSDIAPFKQMMLTLIRLRFNIPFAYLGFNFGISDATACRIFAHTVNVMHDILVPCLILWPSRDVLRQTLPMCFRESAYRKTTCIIDCFEIFIERPSNLKARAQTYSSYKSHNTMKYLIGVTPQGTVSFISDGYGGRTSDKYITQDSGFLDFIQPSDVILADRGFDCHDAIGSQQAELKVPAFTKGKKQLNPVEIEDTRRLASVRIHVERVIGVVRQKYTILQGTVPISTLECYNGKMHLDKIVSVCCALCNVCPSIVSSD